MCRLVIFSGTCTKCGEAQIWEELTQELSCLEAKNNGVFGDCSNGVFQERHQFDQECDECTEEDEGIGDVGEEAEEDVVAHAKRIAEEEKQSTGARKKAKT
ncbi:hypothetical protein Trco_006718 [Trichoderma cornu-damae]|uniref:Uncharacterized protein n=1 Tax=Trichoderma cornu-damae TaxID=654480 RepID=A0A9P8QH99_9HYPO|nr:hypothetical protein Trco_006718 [Trichoderma cornu-damae]